jgi:hypothetical protein
VLTRSRQYDDTALAQTDAAHLRLHNDSKTSDPALLPPVRADASPYDATQDTGRVGYGREKERRVETREKTA